MTLLFVKGSESVKGQRKVLLQTVRKVSDSSATHNSSSRSTSGPKACCHSCSTALTVLMLASPFLRGRRNGSTDISPRVLIKQLLLNCRLFGISQLSVSEAVTARDPDHQRHSYCLRYNRTLLHRRGPRLGCIQQKSTPVDCPTNENSCTRSCTCDPLDDLNKRLCSYS